MVAVYDSTPCNNVFQVGIDKWDMCMHKSGGYTWLFETGKECMFDTYMIHHMVFMIVKRLTIRVIKRTDHVAHINTRL